MEVSRAKELSPDDLSHRCDPKRFPFRTTAELPPDTGTIGQERGVASVEFGLGVRTVGFNVFVAGPPGTGRTMTSLDLLRRRAAQEAPPPDWCYVYNFVDPARPMAISLPAGRGRVFAAQMDEFLRACQREIPRALESEQYALRRTVIGQRLQAAREALLNELRAVARERGFALELGPNGIVALPLDRNGPMSREEFEALPEPQRQAIQQRHQELQPLISQFIIRNIGLEKTAAEQLAALDREIGNLVLAPLIGELLEQNAGQPKVIEYLRQVHDHLLNNLDLFRSGGGEGPGLPPGPSPVGDDPFARYRVNVIVDNGGLTGAPVIVEYNPTYYNLFGRIDYVIRQGVPTTDFRMIKSGALHRANGGYLFLQARDVLASPFAWDGLKRALRSQQILLENLGDQYSAVPTTTLRPEPVPLNVKIVMIGDSLIYRMLHGLDEDFQKHFRVRADFDLTMPRTPENEETFARFIARRSRNLGLRHFERDAVARVVDYAVRLAGDRDKLSTSFNNIANLVDESSHWAGLEGCDVVERRHVDRAIEEKIYRSQMVEERLQELLTNGTILVDVAGTAVGQVNGLSVLDLGDYAFGRPSRITARVGAGNRGVVNVEREINRSGPSHSKGILTLAGYLLGQYGQNGLLSLTASIGFEQVYEEIDGDSASSAELYALLSALADLPIRQGIAVTGSVNQRGQIQAIGGVNEKIEGFFAVCKAFGLTGDQGVMIPASNVRHLFLRDEVIAAVRDGAFHVWSVATVDEGIELLTGVPAGAPDADGRYPTDTVHGRVAARLAALSELVRRRESPRDGA